MSSPVLLTLDDVKQLKAERDSAARELSVLQDRLSELDKKLDVVRAFVPAEYQSELFGERKDEGGGSSKARLQVRKWAPTILPMLEQAGHGLTTQDIRRHLAGTPLEHEVGPQSGALYNALSKMITKGEIVRDGAHYCLPGQGKPEGSDEKLQKSQYEEGVLRVLAQHPDGLRPNGLLGKLRQEPEAFKVQRSTGHFFKILSRLLAEDRVRKEGSRYFINTKNQQESALL